MSDCGLLPSVALHASTQATRYATGVYIHAVLISTAQTCRIHCGDDSSSMLPDVSVPHWSTVYRVHAAMSLPSQAAGQSALTPLLDILGQTPFVSTDLCRQNFE